MNWVPLILSVLLGSTVALAGDGINEQLLGRTYQCTGTTGGQVDTAFKLRFIRYRHKHSYTLGAKFEGQFQEAQGHAAPSANIDFVDPANKTFSVDIGDAISIRPFHHGQPRNFQSRLTFVGGYENASGDLNYVVGRHGDRHRVKTQIVCNASLAVDKQQLQR